MSAACRSCGAAIVWAKTTNGKAMPVDLMPTDDGNIVLLDDGNERGEQTALVVKSGEEHPSVERHKSHFATCPKAASHRKPRA